MLRTDMQARWRWFFLLAALEAGASVVALAAVPRESSGISAARLVLVLLLAGLGLASTALVIRPGFIPALFGHSRVLYLFGSLSVLAACALFLLRYLRPEILLPYYDRLGILLWYALVLGLEALTWGLVVMFGAHRDSLSRLRPLFKPALIASGILAAFVLFVSITGLGLTPDPAYWGEPGVPIMGWQLALALLAGVFAVLLSLHRDPSSKLDLWICISFWIVAAALWLSVPISVVRNSFYEPINPPAYQPFPNSDAGYYDSMAESLLIGYPYQGEIPSRPLYVVFLAALHLLLGERYDLIIAGQTLILALIPAAFYLVGRHLQSRTAGVVAAAIAVFREFTSLLVSSQTRVSNTKMLLVDLPTLLLILIACLAAFRWNRRRDIRSALIAGGAFGALLLLRTQAALILALLLPLSLVVYGRFGLPWVRGVLIFLAGILLVVAPWLVHNYMVSGHLAFDAPFQYQIIASQYRYTGNLDINSIDLQGKSLAGIVLAFALRDPMFVFGFIANHALATQIGGLLVLPLLEPFNGLLQPVNLYWLDWTGHPGGANLVLIVVYLGIIALGLAAAWRRLRWLSFVPLAFSLGYSLGNGLGRFSGWRYDLPADWVAYLYFGVGVAEIFSVLAAFFGAPRQELYARPEPAARARTSGTLLVFPALGFVLIGVLPWLAQGIAMPRYALDSGPRLQETLLASPAVRDLKLTPAELAAYADQPGGVLEIGRVLYPRYFSRNLGLASAHPWPAYAPRDYPRLGFILLNSSRHDVVLPLRGAPGDFENASDAIVLGCQRDGFVEARLVFFPQSDLVFPGMNLGSTCE
jgi:hypothetical protein